MASLNKTKKEITWRTDILPKPARAALDFLSTQDWLRQSEWYLAGGTALALSAGHRKSFDLDFFIQKSDFSEAKLLSYIPDLRPDIAREGTVFGRLREAKISFIAYPFFIPKEPFLNYGSVKILSPRDIAVMKIVAISQRGRKRDFIDLFWYIKNREPLEEILKRLPDQYPKIAHDFHHILKSLNYFDDAEADPTPPLFFQANWRSIKFFFLKEVPKVADKVLRAN